MNVELVKTDLEFLDRLISEIEDKIVYKGKDDTGARVYTLTTECEIDRLAARASNALHPLKWQGETSDETAKLLNWLDAHPATTNRLAVITTKSGTNIQLWNKDTDPGDGITWNKDTVTSLNDTEEKQVSYTIEELQKEWNAYIFMLNKGDEPRNTISFVEFLQTPHEILYADEAIYTVRFNSKKE